MHAAYISHPDCLKHDMGSHHPEAPERLSAIADMLLMKGILDFMDCYQAPLASDAQLAGAHSLQYIQRIRGQAPQPGQPPVQIDPDTSMNAGTMAAALRAAGAAVLATDLVLGGRASFAFCNVRPPGHHAESAAAGGFCFFNNVVVGIRHALDVHGLERVALIDFDVHHGNGSEDILCQDQRVLMCSVFEDKLYPFTGNLSRGANMINLPLPARSGGDAMRAAVTAHWLPALQAFRPQMIFISAGFDGHREDDMGNLGWVEADYAWLTRQILAIAKQHAGGRIVSCLEGGYALSALARSATAHLRVLLGLD